MPVYDSTGNLAVMTDLDGKPVERYRYGPYSGRKVLTDLTPPEVEQVRAVGGELWLEISEPWPEPWPRGGLPSPRTPPGWSWSSPRASQ